MASDEPLFDDRHSPLSLCKNAVRFRLVSELKHCRVPSNDNLDQGVAGPSTYAVSESDENALRSIVESSSDCLYVPDLPGRILMVNEAGKCFMDAETNASLGTDWATLWETCADNRVNHAVAAARASEAGGFLAGCRSLSGTPRPDNTVVLPLLDVAGIPAQLLAVTREVMEADTSPIEEGGSPAAASFDPPATLRTVALLAALAARNPRGHQEARHEIAERKRVESALRESEVCFRLMADSMPQIAWTATADGSVDHYNQGWHTYSGLTLDATRSWGWQAVIHPDDMERATAVWVEAIRTGTVSEVEYRLRSHTGEFRWFLGRSLPIRE